MVQNYLNSHGKYNTIIILMKKKKGILGLILFLYILSVSFASAYDDNGNINCVDSDNGKNFLLRGSVSASEDEYPLTDFCYGENTLIEYYCNPDERINSITYQCEDGCKNGACIEHLKERGTGLESITGFQVAGTWPASDIHATTDAIAATIRTQLTNQIWSGRGLPTRLANFVEGGVNPALLAPTIPLPNLASVDRYTIITNGNTVQPWVLRPITSNGQLAIIGLGHTLTGNLKDLIVSTSLVAEALSRGNVVLIITMPNGGVDGHDLLGKNGIATFHPMEYFVSPSIVALNQYLSENPIKTYHTIKNVQNVLNLLRSMLSFVDIVAIPLPRNE